MVVSILNSKTDVKKAAEAIQCKNNFSLLQRKMYNVLLANVFALGTLRFNTTHRISIGCLCKLMGYDSKDYKTIKAKFRELRRIEIEWDVTNENGNNVWTNTSPLSLARIIEGEGICEYEFTPSLIPFLEKPAQYATFTLGVQAKFKSSYGLALYENCERYKKIGQTRYFDLLTFRKLMGVSVDEYKDFFSFKQRVIVKAIDEVNKYADFEITPQYTKQLRNIVGLKFYIKMKSSLSEKMVLSEMCIEPKKSGELYVENMDEGLLYAMLDFNGDLIGGVLTWPELPESFPKGDVSLVTIQPFHAEILIAISKKGYSKLENCTNKDANLVNDPDLLEIKVTKYFGVSKKRYGEYLKNYGRDYLAEKVDFILNSDPFRKGIIRNMAGYLKTALSEDFKETVNSKAIIKSKCDSQEALNELKAKKSKIEFDINELYKSYLAENIEEVILKKITNEKCEDLLQQFQYDISNTYYAGIYASEGLKNSLIRSSLADFLLKNHNDIVKSVAPFKKYVEEFHSEAKREVKEINMAIENRLKKEQQL